MFRELTRLFCFFGGRAEGAITIPRMPPAAANPVAVYAVYGVLVACLCIVIGGFLRALTPARPRTGAAPTRLIALAGVGVQVETGGRSVIYQRERIASAFIHEAIHWHSVRHYLFLRLAAPARALVPLFAHARPPLSRLVPVYRALTACLSGGVEAEARKQ